MDDGANSCRACSGRDLVATVARERLPAMQNYIYRSLDKALHANVGRLRLDVCRTCGFAFNALFDPALLDYDQGYDNTVPSQVMSQYYEELAADLHEKYLPQGGLLLDIGCGKGMFLETMSRLFPDTEGLGIDPAHEGPARDEARRLRYIRECFAAQHVDQRPNLVICRHVVEHMNPPVDFLRSLRLALQAYPGVPFFVEVPDLNWIIEHQSFWDFCYEHCNYFTPASLANAVQMAGFRTTRSRTAFGDQFIWLEAVGEATSVDEALPEGDGTNLIHRLQQYKQAEEARIEQARARISELRRQQWKIVVWGMSTKGILFSYLVDPQRHLIDYCVDVNRNKQDCYAPVTGHHIESPDVLPVEFADRLAIVVMNENYLKEIAATCHDRGLRPMFLNASGELLRNAGEFE